MIKHFPEMCRVLNSILTETKHKCRYKQESRIRMEHYRDLRIIPKSDRKHKN